MSTQTIAVNTIPANVKVDVNLEHLASACTDKQRRYAEARAIGLLQLEAALRAGFPPKGAHVQANRLEKHPKVRAYIDALVAKAHAITQQRAEEQQAAIMGATEVLERLTEHGRADIAALWDPERPGTLDLERAVKSGASRLIKRYRVKSRAIMAEGAQVGTEVEQEVELHPVQGALDKLGKHHKLWDGESSSVRIGILQINKQVNHVLRSLTDAQLAALIEATAPKGAE